MADRYRVTDNGVRLRKSPGTSAEDEILREYSAGTVVIEISDETPSADGHEWRNVRGPDGREGFMAADLLALISDANGATRRAILSAAELYDLVHKHGAGPDLDRIMVAAALAESGGNTEASGDNGHSIGLWQLHDRGLGSGMSVEERQNPDTACLKMLPVFRGNFTRFKSDGLAGKTLATQTYLFTERPFQFDVPGNAAGKKFGEKWDIAVL